MLTQNAINRLSYIFFAVIHRHHHAHERLLDCHGNLACRSGSHVSGKYFCRIGNRKTHLPEHLRKAMNVRMFAHRALVPTLRNRNPLVFMRKVILHFLDQLLRGRKHADVFVRFIVLAQCRCITRQQKSTTRRHFQESPFDLPRQLHSQFSHPPQPHRCI